MPFSFRKRKKTILAEDCQLHSQKHANVTQCSTIHHNSSFLSEKNSNLNFPANFLNFQGGTNYSNLFLYTVVSAVVSFCMLVLFW